MPIPNEKQIRKYLENNGEECLFCESRNINVIECAESETAGMVVQHAECYDCDEEWKANYMLKSVYINSNIWQKSPDDFSDETTQILLKNKM